MQAPRDTVLDDLVLRLLISAPWLSAIPLVGIYFALPLDCLTSHATRWEQIMSTYLFASSTPDEAVMHLDALALEPLPESWLNLRLFESYLW